MSRVISFPGVPCSSQDKEAAHLDEMRDQRSMFEQQLAQSAQSASEQRTKFEERLAQSARSLAQAGRDIRDMKEAHEQGALLASEDAEVKRKISVGVRAFSVRNTHARQTSVHAKHPCTPNTCPPCPTAFTFCVHKPCAE